MVIGIVLGVVYGLERWLVMCNRGFRVILHGGSILSDSFGLAFPPFSSKRVAKDFCRLNGIEYVCIEECKRFVVKR